MLAVDPLRGQRASREAQGEIGSEPEHPVVPARSGLFDGEAGEVFVLVAKESTSEIHVEWELSRRRTARGDHAGREDYRASLPNLAEPRGG